MEKDLDASVIKATQTLLGKYVKRPPLTDKLLKKPPFRFLHDIVTSVLKTTGFFEGLFDEEELVSDNVKDRENKIVFLNKVITVVGLTTGKTLAAKPSKIVAGQEPEKTNELLQCIAQALDKNLSSDEAVRKFKDGAKLSKPEEKEKRTKDATKQTKKATEPNKLTSKSSEKLTTKKKESGVRSSKNDNEKTESNNKSKQKDKSSTENESPPRKASQNSKLLASKKPSIEKKIPQKNEKIRNLKEDNVEIKGVEKLDDINDSTDLRLDMVDQSVDSAELAEQTETVLKDQSKDSLDNNSFTIKTNGLNSSLSSQDLMDTENVKSLENSIIEQDNVIHIENNKPIEQIITNGTNDDNEDTHGDELNELPINNKSSPNGTLRMTDINKKEEVSKVDVQLTKPSSSEVKAIVRPLSVRPSSSRPGAPRPRDKHDNIITEAENVLVGKVNIIAESSPNEEEEDASIVIVEHEASNAQAVQEQQEKLQASIDEHGHLVQQILESQKEYSQMSGKTEIEWQFGAQKARDALNKEIEQLRFDIQALSRVANPLGKVLDHIQEDVEVMRQELNQWTKTYEETTKELLKQKAANEDSLNPLYTKVKQLGTDIQEKHGKINDLKIIIHKNSVRIDKLLANGSVQ